MATDEHSTEALEPSNEQAEEASEANLSAAWWRVISQRRVEDVTKRLDPSELDAILERIRQLAEKAKHALSGGEEMHLLPGIEGIAWLATQLASAHHVVRVRGDYRQRHRDALRILTETNTDRDQSRRVEEIIEDAAQIGWAEELDDENRSTGRRQWLTPAEEANAIAVPWVMRLLEGSFPGARPTEDSILKALACYRKPKATIGRPRTGIETTTAEERMEALRPLLDVCGVVTAGDLDSTVRRQRRASKK